MKIQNALMAAAMTLALMACGGGDTDHMDSAGADNSSGTDPGVRGFLEIDGERFELTWTSCANRPEQGYQRWLADDGDDMNFQFHRYEPSASADEYRYSMRLFRRDHGVWENHSTNHQPSIQITEEAVAGHGVIYPRETPVRDRDDFLVPIRFEFSCPPRR